MFDLKETDLFYNFIHVKSDNWIYVKRDSAFVLQSDRKFRIKHISTSPKYECKITIGSGYDLQNTQDLTFDITYDGCSDQEVIFYKIQYGRRFYVPKIPDDEKEIGECLVNLARILNEDHLYCDMGSAQLMKTIGYSIPKYPQEMYY